MSIWRQPHWFIPPSVYFHPHILSAPFYLFHSVSVIMSVLSFYSVGSTRTLLFRQSRARVVGAPLSSRLLLSHRTPEPRFKGLLGLAVYPERLIWHGWHLAGLRRIPLHRVFALKYSHGSCISFILYYLFGGLKGHIAGLISLDHFGLCIKISAAGWITKMKSISTCLSLIISSGRVTGGWVRGTPDALVACHRASSQGTAGKSRFFAQLVFCSQPAFCIGKSAKPSLQQHAGVDLFVSYQLASNQENQNVQAYKSFSTWAAAAPIYGGVNLLWDTPFSFSFFWDTPGAKIKPRQEYSHEKILCFPSFWEKINRSNADSAFWEETTNDTLRQPRCF